MRLEAHINDKTYDIFCHPYAGDEAEPPFRFARFSAEVGGMQVENGSLESLLEQISLYHKGVEDGSK